MKGYTRAVLSLVVGANRLYFGSMDKTVWDLQALQCVQILNGHADVVMSVLCWDSFLLSGTLDNTIKVWAATESGNLSIFLMLFLARSMIQSHFYALPGFHLIVTSLSGTILSYFATCVPMLLFVD
ncbi:unnamed protein product [Ilex paraguariensis]|uniref:Uncharacterized protein n=1 Tax=Ilex paraguariensis TaxID=185542 RepID=A0ABC8SBW0_9AQUA